MGEEWTTDTQVLLDSLNHREVQACSISIVPVRLRNGKEEVYTPKVVSIGALTNGTRGKLQLGQQLKAQYTEFLLGRTRIPDDSRIKNCHAAMLELDDIVRACYGRVIDIERHNLAKIMFLDGCFVLELLFRFRSYREPNSWHDGKLINSVLNSDPIFRNVEKLNSVLNDLTILGNQIPFVVLKILYGGIFPSELAMKDDHRVADLALSALGYDQGRPSCIAHLLHLIHLSCVNPEDNHPTAACQELRRSATKLQEVGISIEAEGSNPDNMSLMNKFDFEITFADRTLNIPPVHIKKTTETSWRNLIAWEQSRIGIKSKFTSYALFFRGLICSEQDIELLLESRVIVKPPSIRNHDLLTMFRTIADGVDHMDLSYSELCVSLNEYQPAKPSKELRRIIIRNKYRSIVRAIRDLWETFLRTLLTKPIPTLLKIVGALVTITMLALTIAQTYYAAHGPNKSQSPGK